MSYQPTQPAVYQSPFTQEEAKPFSWTIVIKIAYLFIFSSLLITAVFFAAKKLLGKKSQPASQNIIMVAGYKMTLWRDFGEVFEPLIKIPIYYPERGYKNQEFLLDSGAVVSSLPREMANRLGFSLARLPRSTFAGFGGTTSFAYKANVKILLGKTEATIPVVFTEAAGTKSILGRSGFFENYSVYFNSKANKIEIRN